MKKIFVIAGHSDTDSGAVATHDYLVKEADYTKKLKYLIVEYFKAFNDSVEVFVDDDKDNLQTVINKINKIIKADDLLIDLHFNAFNGKATGTEVIVPGISSKLENSIATEICKQISDILEIPNRGVKPESQTARGRIGILKGVGNRILLEICFIDNPKDYRAYKKHEHMVAMLITNVIEKLWVETKK